MRCHPVARFFNRPHAGSLPDLCALCGKIDGIMSEQNISDITAQLTYGTWRYQKNWKPLHIVDAEGVYFFDAAGKKYLDFSSQLMCSHLGHKNKTVIKAIQEQAQQLAYAAPGFATTVRAELSEMLLDVLPKGLQKFFFTC